MEKKQLLLMTHAVVGYPSLDDNWTMLEAMNEAGVSLVELQMPFSEPIADGPVFVKANQDALQNGIAWDEYFDFMRRATSTFDFPIIYMGYYNSVFCMGHETFCQRLKDSGCCGYIIGDLPPEQAAELDICAGSHNISPIHLMTPTNTDKRLEKITHNASGFIYCVARKGVTGRKTSLDNETAEYIQRCRAVTELPIALGFGIKAKEDIQLLKTYVDIAIIGTACLEVWEQHGADAYSNYLCELSNAAT